MDSKNTLLLLILSLSCLILHTNAAAATATGARPHVSLLRKRTPQIALLNLCKGTTKPSLCVKTILPNMDFSVHFRHHKALEIAIIAAQNQTMKTSDLIASLILNPSTPKNVVDDLKVCKEQFKNMLDAVKESLTEVAESKNAVEASYKFSGFMASRATCEDGFSSTGKVSPIDGDVKLSYDLGSVVLDIMAAIKERSLKRVARRFGSLIPPVAPSMTVKSGDPCYNVIGTCSH
ncbi:hypothetical protein PIB30_011797 [Stylosanthes scabra]|uniref:Pectinesterase inhibitor domain-containing protein n=1 Tax=Stylosanthes scabra TaxID=79078 RepID=A0ABU6R4U2_9FABA|nr:hypothetical protein [Stylosanthes scabra]